MKSYRIELRKVKAMSNGAGVIRAHVDAEVLPAAARGDDVEPATVLSLSEETARVLVLLLKAQLAELDSRKAKSRR